MNCPNCGAAMTLVPQRTFLVCEYCTTFHLPEESHEGVRVLGEASALACPLCNETLVSAAIDDVAVLHCKKCKGVLVEQEKLPIRAGHRRHRHVQPLHRDVARSR